MLFVDDVVMFGCGTFEKWSSYKNILDSLYSATRMEISENKSVVLESSLDLELKDHIKCLFPCKFQDLDCGFKYLGY